MEDSLITIVYDDDNDDNDLNINKADTKLIKKKIKKKIKKITKKTYIGKYYKKKELRGIIEHIETEIKDTTNNIIVHEYITKYMHFCTDHKKYYFDVNKIQKSKKKKLRYSKLLLTNNKSNKKQNKEHKKKSDKYDVKIIKENIKKKTKIVSDSDSDSDNDSDVDLTKEEMDELKRKFYLQMNPSEKCILDSEIVKSETMYDPIQKFTRNDDEYGPHGSQHVNEEQINDKIDKDAAKKSKQFDKLRAIILPEQRSKEWFDMRMTKITASDGGTVLGKSKYNATYTFILKKTIGTPFKPSEPCYHGTKLEEVATMIYEYRMNVQVDEFGLMGHSVHPFLGASPDGICNKYKLNGKNLSKYVGRMLEIKCPFSRKIEMSGAIKGHICPIHYWIQVQLQLECCDLEECDFWQCTISEYKNLEEFLEDTDEKESFRSKTTGFEKGCLIQLLPKNKMQYVTEKNYNYIVYEHSKFIYAPKIEMTPLECSLWISNTINNIDKHPSLKQKDHGKYVFDKVKYWRLDVSKNVIIKRDREWFSESLPKFEKMWNYVLFLRENKDVLDLFVEYINLMERKNNKQIMKLIDDLYNGGSSSIKRLKKEIKVLKIMNNVEEEEEKNERQFQSKFVFRSKKKNDFFIN